MYKQVCLKYWIFAITICGSICTGCLLQLLVQNFFFPINITENMSIISSIVAVLSLVFSIMAFTFKMNSFKQEHFLYVKEIILGKIDHFQREKEYRKHI